MQDSYYPFVCILGINKFGPCLCIIHDGLLFRSHGMGVYSGYGDVYRGLKIMQYDLWKIQHDKYKADRLVER